MLHSMARLSVNITRRQGLVTVTIDGEIDRGNADDVTRSLDAAARLAIHTVVVDAQGVTFLDAAGRRALELPPRARPVSIILLPSPAIRRFDGRSSHALQPHAA